MSENEFLLLNHDKETTRLHAGFFFLKKIFIHIAILIFTGVGRRRGEKEQRKPRTTRAKRIQRGRKGGVRDGG
jgi:hypothetical protein